MKKLKFFSAILFSFPIFSWAALIELNGSGYTYKESSQVENFDFGYVIDLSVLDSNSDPVRGTFNGAIKNGYLRFRSSFYELDSSIRGNLDIRTQDYSNEDNMALGTVNFKSTFINGSGDVLELFGYVRSLHGSIYLDAGVSLVGLATPSLFFEGDADFQIEGQSQYAGLWMRTSHVQEPAPISLFLLGILGVLGTRLLRVFRINGSGELK